MYEHTQVDKDEIVTITAHMIRLYLNPSSDTSLLEPLLELLLLLIETTVITPSSLFEPVLSLLKIPSMIPLCMDFLVVSAAIRRVSFLRVF